MYSTFATTTDDALSESPLLFSQSHDDLSSISLPHDGVHLKAPASNMVPLSGLGKFNYGHSNESTPSSMQNGDIRNTSEATPNHVNGRESRDRSASTGYRNGQERVLTPSPSPFPYFTQGALANGTSHESDHGVSKTDYGAQSVNGETIVDPPTSSLLSKPSSKSIKQEFTGINSSTGTSTRRSTTSTTPEIPQKQGTSNTHNLARLLNPIKGKGTEPRANSSIPSKLSWEEFARQSILAAESSRLNPFALHPEEYKLLRTHITHPQVTIYLNIRNAILRLWTRNPLVSVTWEEAAGCARDKRYFGLAKVAYYWLLRNGYINHGCVQVVDTGHETLRRKTKATSQRTVLVVGAGMSGLGCARHLEALFAQLGEHWTSRGELPPKVILLEARPRVGGRVYSHPLHNQTSSSIPAGHRCTAEMGAQIVTGFDRGNPLNTLIRGQLGLPYHGLRDNTVLYDHDGTIVDRRQDRLVERLYNDVLERASAFRNKSSIFRTVEGERNLILFGRDPTDNEAPTVAEMEHSNTPLPTNAITSASTVEEKPSSGIEKLAGRAYQLSAGFDSHVSATEAAVNMGWDLRPGVERRLSLNLDRTAKSCEYPTLGETMDDGFVQYQDLIDLTPRDLRLLNWHHANLEYANATSVNRLSLSGWDQDIGNEWEGEHTEIIGGYQQVPRGLWQCPGKLDIRFQTPIKSVQYKEGKQKGDKAVLVKCHNGEEFEADELVLTTPLGVLKSGSITFNPPLPDWKQTVIERMGFGLLNKVILVYEEPFWEVDRDMFGLLNDSERQQASLDMKDYSYGRGRFYLFWNCIKTSGRPMLVALMAGDSAHYAEAASDSLLVEEVTERLAKIFAPKTVPRPSETIVTRWSKDPYARGSYSYVGSRTQAGDYDVMARPHGPIHFAGEATCGTHPATVHGAYLSGLRAAAEIVEAMIGPIEVATPLIERAEKRMKLERLSTDLSNHLNLPLQSPKAQSHHFSNPQFHSTTSPPNNRNERLIRDEDYEASIIGAILSEIGERPVKPGRAGVNPFLLYTKDYWYICKKECDEARRAATGDSNAKATKTEIRTALGAMWRNATEQTKKPYLDQTQSAKDDATASAASFKERAAQWDKEAARIRKVFIKQNPPPGGGEDLVNGRTAIELGSGKRIRRS